MAGIMPLNLRFEQLSLKILIKNCTSNSLVIKNFIELQDLNHNSKILQIWHDYLTLGIKPLLTNTPPPISHQTNLPDEFLSIDISMTYSKKIFTKDTLPEIAPKLFGERFGNVNLNNAYFTDGSKINGKTGCGVFSRHRNISLQLEAPCTVFVAELAAISCALEDIASRQTDRYAIFTDSLSAIETIRS